MRRYLFIFLLNLSVLQAVPLQAQSYQLQNSTLSVDIDANEFMLSITDLRSGDTWQTSEVYDLELQRVDTGPNAFTFHYRYLYEPMDLSIHVALDTHTLAMGIRADSAQALSDVISCPGFIDTRSGEYLVIPRAAGLMMPVTDFPGMTAFEMWDHKATLPFIGVTDLSRGWMLTSDAPWDTEIEFLRHHHTYTFRMHHHPARGHFGYNRTFYYTFFNEGGYNAMARWYRHHLETRGLVKSFAEKRGENPAIDKLTGAVDIWMDHPMVDAAFVQDLVDSGIDKAIFSLCGGLEENPQAIGIIDEINALGLLSSRYDIFTDVWPPDHPECDWLRTTGYPEDVIVLDDGSLQEGWLTYLDDGTPFQGFYTCSATHSDYARNHIARDLAVNPFNCRFIDVEMSSPLYECYSPVHPTGRRQDAAHRRNAMKMIKDEFGLVTGSEEARHWSFDVTDYGEGTMSIVPDDSAGYDWMTPTNALNEAYHIFNMNPRVRIPLMPLVCSDGFAPTWYTGDGLSKAPMYWRKKELFTLLYGAMMLVMPPSRAYWHLHEEAFLSSMNVCRALFGETADARMSAHCFLTQDRNVQQTEFDNGWRVTANFKNDAYHFNGLDLPGLGFYASDGSGEVFRKLNGADTLTAVILEDRLFIQPHGAVQPLKGVRTSGAVFLQNRGSYIHLAFIGGQQAIQFHPERLPWPISNPEVYVRGGMVPLALSDAGDGWLQIDRHEGERFYRIENGDPTGIETQSVEKALTLQIFNNPGNPESEIRFEIPRSGRVRLRLYNTLGQLVAELMNEPKSAGNYSIQFRQKGLASGVYVCRLNFSGRQVVRKVVVQK